MPLVNAGVRNRQRRFSMPAAYRHRIIAIAAAIGHGRAATILTPH